MLGASSKPKPGGKPKNQLIKNDLGGPGRLVLSASLIFLASQFVAGLLVGIGLGLVGTAAFEQAASAQFLYILAAEAISVGSVLVIVKKRRLSLSAIGLGRRLYFSDIWRAAAALIVFWIFLILTFGLIKLLVPGLDTDQAQDIGFNNLTGPADLVLAFIALVLLAPIGEEVLMRGYLFSGLRARLNFTTSLIITSLIFGLAHLQFGAGTALVWVAAVHTFILSGVLVYLREKTGALHSSMILHSLNNTVAFIAYFWNKLL
ncbi:MAG: type II CAAX endopeptidase family protein [Candidatus Saccharimonadales bacterium]